MTRSTLTRLASALTLASTLVLAAGTAEAGRGHRGGHHSGGSSSGGSSVSNPPRPVTMRPEDLGGGRRPGTVVVRDHRDDPWGGRRPYRPSGASAAPGGVIVTTTPRGVYVPWPQVRDHRTPVVVRDHRDPPGFGPTVRDHRTGARPARPLVRDHRTVRPRYDASGAQGGVMVTSTPRGGWGSPYVRDHRY